jgi:Uma2 family endonuclease
MATAIRTRVVHPHIETWQFDALQENTGWSMDVELIAGEAVLVLPLGPPASSAEGELHAALHRWQEESGDEGLLMIEVFVAFPDGSRLGPDISWWNAERRPPMSRGAMQAVPDLIVEVLSPSTRANDEGVKRELYMRSGVRELWLVDPDARTVTRVRPGASPDEVLGEGSTLTSDLLEGFAIEIACIFTLPSNLADGGSR